MILYKLRPGWLLAVGDPDEAGLLPIWRFELAAVLGWPDHLAAARAWMEQQLAEVPEPFRPAASTLAVLPLADIDFDREAYIEAKLGQLPGWATWTADEAVAWVDANVIDLESAKTALKALVRMVVHLRDLTL